MTVKSFVSFTVPLSLWFILSGCSSKATSAAFVPSSTTTPPRPLRNVPPATAPSQRPFSSPSSTTCATSTTTVASTSSCNANDVTSTITTSTTNRNIDDERQAWIERSVQYYSKVMREERRRNLGQLSSSSSSSSSSLSSLSLHEHNHNRNLLSSNHNDFVILAKKHYFALRKIKDGKPAHAESIYRRILGELLSEGDDNCDHAQLAVTTLLLALLLQGRQQQQCDADPKQVRAVFLNFFRIVCNSEEQCACSAKVLQAFALFEMKQGNPLKSLYLVRRALQLDPTLQPVLQWKQFRDAVRRDAQRVAP